MLQKLVLENYRCYDKHTIEFKSTSIVVGKNNAGKSTIIEALRLLSIAIRRYSTINYSLPPEWTNLSRLAKGFKPSIQGFEFSLQNIFHKYGDPPAIIEGHFYHGECITIYVGPDAQVFVTVKDVEGSILKQRGKVLEGIKPINILPQIGALNRREVVLNRDYIRQNLETDLSSIHFRNQIYRYKEFFPRFVEIIESTWRTLHVREFLETPTDNGEELSLMIQDYDFVAEIGWMGHGLQMWAQIM